MKLAKNLIQHHHTEDIDIRSHFISSHFRIELRPPPLLNAEGYCRARGSEAGFYVTTRSNTRKKGKPQVHLPCPFRPPLVSICDRGHHCIRKDIDLNWKYAKTDDKQYGWHIHDSTTTRHTPHHLVGLRIRALGGSEWQSFPPIGFSLSYGGLFIYLFLNWSYGGIHQGTGSLNETTGVYFYSSMALWLRGVCLSTCIIPFSTTSVIKWCRKAMCFVIAWNTAFFGKSRDPLVSPTNFIGHFNSCDLKNCPRKALEIYRLPRCLCRIQRNCLLNFWYPRNWRSIQQECVSISWSLPQPWRAR